MPQWHSIKPGDQCAMALRPIMLYKFLLNKKKKKKYVMNAKETGVPAQLGQVDVRDEKRSADQGIEPGTLAFEATSL